MWPWRIWVKYLLVPNLIKTQQNENLLHCCWCAVNKKIKRYQEPFLLTWIIFNLSVDKKYAYYRVWYENIYPIPNFNGSTVQVWKWISNFFPHFTGHVITYICRDLRLFMLVKRTLGNFMGPHNIWDRFLCDDTRYLFAWSFILCYFIAIFIISPLCMPLCDGISIINSNICHKIPTRTLTIQNVSNTELKACIVVDYILWGKHIVDEFNTICHLKCYFRRNIFPELMVLS